MATVLITGGAGFIGSALTLRWRQMFPTDRVVVLDAFTYAGHRISLESLQEGDHFRVVAGDITKAATVAQLLDEERVDLLLHLAAESHVDRSIHGPGVCTSTNVLGTQVLLDAARTRKVPRFVMVSTDEVYGPAPDGVRFAEDAPLRPSSPYAASKASAELLCQAYVRTYGMDVVTTRGCNTYGPRQTPEKLIPLMLTRALANAPLPLYGDGLHRRDWIHVEDHARGVIAAATRGRAGGVYNLGSGEERTNLELVETLLGHVGGDRALIRFVADRPGHDRRYALDVERARMELGFAPECTLDAGLASTVAWYRSNTRWVEEVQKRVEEGEFTRAWYGPRLGT